MVVSWHIQSTITRLLKGSCSKCNSFFMNVPKMLIKFVSQRIITLVEGGLNKRGDSRISCVMDMQANKQGTSDDNKPDDSIITLEFIGKLFLGILYSSMFNLIILLTELVV